jgi:predicted oxidoreductase
MAMLSELLQDSLETSGCVNATLIHDGGTLDNKTKFQVCPFIWSEFCKGWEWWTN